MRKAVLAGSIAVVSILACCSPVMASILEMPMVHNFHADYQESASRLHISGMDGSSAEPIRKFVIRRRKSEISVLIHLTLFRKGKGFDFDEQIDIPPDVDRVTFGKEKFEIWKRP
jgi:hypothetical protein